MHDDKCLCILLPDKTTKRGKHQASEDLVQETRTLAPKIYGNIRSKSKNNKAGKKNVQSKEQEDKTVNNKSSDSSEVKQRKRKVKANRSQEGIVYTEEEESETEDTFAGNRRTKKPRKATNVKTRAKDATKHSRHVQNIIQSVQETVKKKQKGGKIRRDAHDDETKKSCDEVGHGSDGEGSIDELECAFNDLDDDDSPDAWEVNEPDIKDESCGGKDAISVVKEEQGVDENEMSRKDTVKTLITQDDMDAKKTKDINTLTACHSDINKLKLESIAKDTSHSLGEDDQDNDLECTVIVSPKLKTKLWNRKELKTHNEAQFTPVSSSNNQVDCKVKILSSVHEVQDNKIQDQCDKIHGPGGKVQSKDEEITHAKDEAIKDTEDDDDDQDQNDEAQDEDMESDQYQNGSSKDIPKEMIRLNRSEWEKYDISSESKQCPICNKAFPKILSLTRHLKTHLIPSARPFPCYMCDNGYVQRAELDKHLALHERNTVRMYKCPICREAFCSQKTLEQHITRFCSGERGKKPFKCEGCQNSYATEDHLVNHRCKTKQYPQCEKCGERFTLRQKFEEHCEKHKSYDAIKCFVCQSEFRSTEELITHIDIHTQNGKQPFVCGLCKMSCGTEATLLKHDCRPISKRMKDSYKCQTCEKILFTYHGYKNHLKLHKDDRRFMCTACGKCFRYSKDLENHEAIHSDERPFKCEICDASFKTLRVLQSHMVIHAERSAWRFQCDTCGKSFQRSAGLRSHVQIHQPEKDYKCTECSKTFLTNQALSFHMRTHSSEKPHVCELCGRGFRQLQHLRTHMLTHTGEKQFSCEYCFKEFARAGDLRVHVRTHTGEKPYVCECGRAYAQPGGLLSHCRSTGHAKAIPVKSSPF